MANNRKTTHRRSNGRLVTVRSVQYPPKGNSRSSNEDGENVGRYCYNTTNIRYDKFKAKSIIRHAGTIPQEIVISGIGNNTKHKENLPNKGRRDYN